MKDEIVFVTAPGADLHKAEVLAAKLNISIAKEAGEGLTLYLDQTGLSLKGYGLSYQGDFDQIYRRVDKGRYLHEMLVKAAKIKKEHPRAIDATAGMGEDSFLLAAMGYEVTLCEQNPVVSALLTDALERAMADETLSEIVGRMHVYEGDSVAMMNAFSEPVDLIYLDPMFPERQKSGLINKKLQLIQKLEPPCSEEKDLFDAAVKAHPSKIVVKRPLKAPHLDGRKPNHMIKGKAIRYDCYVIS